MKVSQYVTSTGRNLTRRRSTPFLNALGLGIGLAGCLVIFLILKHEFSYDRYHRNAGSIYELVKDTKTADGDHYHCSIPFPFVKALRQDFPRVPFTELFRLDAPQVTVMGAADKTDGSGRLISVMTTAPLRSLSMPT